MIRRVTIHPSRYVDSVTLMQVSQEVTALDGVSRAQAGMATELNLELLTNMGFEIPADITANDMIVAIEAAEDALIDQATDEIERLLKETAQGSAGGQLDGTEGPPHSITSATKRSDAPVVLLSVPGQHAFSSAMEALDAGRSVMIFSDNVPVEHEIVLKDTATERNLLVMGPDCGTAILGGVALGFANAVRPGPVGVVAASGTGAQQLTCLLDAAGVGITHCLGLGGRDLSAAVAGRSAKMALKALDEDPDTTHIVLVSKPPAPEVAEELRNLAQTLSKPVIFALLGEGQPTLTQATEEVLAALGEPAPQWQQWRPENPPATSGTRGEGLRGLYAGGTLCDESMLLALAELGEVYSNIPLDPKFALEPGGALPAGAKHLMIDFGDDEFTRGRPHPMIDGSIRTERLLAEAADPTCGVILLDVVLGSNAQANPAGELAPAISQALEAAAAQGRALTVVISLCGTTGDAQGLQSQAQTLTNSGAHVFLSNAQAAAFAIQEVSR